MLYVLAGYIGELGTALWTSFTLTNESLATMQTDGQEQDGGTRVSEVVRECLTYLIQ